MGDKSVETPCNKIEFLTILVTFPPFPLGGRFPPFLPWEAGGIRELTLEANKIEQMLKYWKLSFPKSVSTAFVPHCSPNVIKRDASGR